VLFLLAITSGETGSSSSYLHLGSGDRVVSPVLAVDSGVAWVSMVVIIVSSVVTSVLGVVDIVVDVPGDVVDDDVLVGSS